MSVLENAMIGVQSPIVDKRLKDKISFVTTCIIPTNICELFTRAINAIADQLNEEGIMPERVPSITCIFTESDTFSIRFDDNQESVCMTLCVYRLDRILVREEIKRLVIIVEELAHIIWNIKNEYKICFKVHGIIRRIIPDISITDLYNMQVAEQYKE